MKRPKLAVLTSALLLSACARGEALHGPAPRVTSGRALRAARVVEARATPASPAWQLAGTAAILGALPVDVSFEEVFLLPADTPAALAWAVPLTRGERVEIEVRAEADATPPFVDVFEPLGRGRYEHIMATPAGAATFELEALRDGPYVLRVQPQPGGGGRYRVSVRTTGISVQFPVAGADASAIRSGFGEARDDGTRSHDGVDIFAPRGTPVVAVADAIVDAVRSTGSGGRVIWARDVQGRFLYYYAHLEEQLVRKGERIAAGDTIGRVGNSGNASGASPHLHFGLYRPGYEPIDPTPLLGGTTRPLPAAADTVTRSLGARAETRGTDVRLRRSPHAAATILDQLAPGTVLYVVGAIGEWRRVRLADGRAGFIAAHLLQPALPVAQ